MLETGSVVLAQFGSFVHGANVLNPESFQAIDRNSFGTLLATVIILLAGLSQGIGQAIVLFLNRVSPVRFVLSLGIAAILFVLSTVFWVLSVWLASRWLYGVETPFLQVFRVLGLAYAPLLWSFLVALPYLGIPIQIVLSIWSLLAFVRGLSFVAGLDRWQVLWSAIFGWLVFQIMQRTIGRPAIALGQWLSSSVAGAPLVTNLRELEEMVQSEFAQRFGDASGEQGRE